MKPATAWILKHFPYSMLVRNQSLFLKLSVVIFIITVLFEIFYTEDYNVSILLALSFAFILIFISSFLPRKETKITSLVTQSGALEMLNISPLPIFTYEKRDDEIFIRFANNACHKSLAHNNKSLIQQPINQLVMLEDEGEMLSVCEETLAGEKRGVNHIFFIRGRTADDAITKFMCSTSKIKWLEQDIGICFLFDISESENQYVEMQSHVNEGYKSALIAGIVHDFRNVLNGMIGTAEVLQFEIDDEAVRDKLEIIIDSGERGADIITNLLQVSSNSHDEELKTQIRDIKPDLKSIISLLRLQLPGTVKLLSNIESHLPLVKVGTTPLEQILTNLVNNAAQAMNKENGIITIHANPTRRDNQNALKIIVADNGCGISEEDLPFITDNFWSKRKDSGGTGLGMAMVKRVVSLQGGDLEITSKLGVGTQMTIYFPCYNEETTVPLPESDAELHPTIQPRDSVQDEPVVLTQASAQDLPIKRSTITTSQFTTKPCSILLVDDQASVLQVQQMLLEAMGHKVITATDGNKAIKLFISQKENIQMVITDFKMPGINGIELAQKLRRISANIPLLMVTGYGEQESLKRAKNLHMTIIRKPTNLKKFSEAVTETQLKYPNIFS